MKIIKLKYHIFAAIKKIVYKIVFGSKVKIGKKTTWRSGFHIAIENGGKVVVENNCFFNHNCSLNAMELVTIGEGTIFGENVHVYDHNHRFSDESRNIKSQGYTTGATRIGKHCWLGTGVIVLKGVTIGDNCVIGAGVVVKEDVSANTVLEK